MLCLCYLTYSKQRCYSSAIREIIPTINLLAYYFFPYVELSPRIIIWIPCPQWHDYALFPSTLYQPPLFNLTVNLLKCDLFEQPFNLSLYCTIPNKEVTFTFYYVFNKEFLCSYGRKIKYQLSANPQTLFSTSVSSVRPFCLRW